MSAAGRSKPGPSPGTLRALIRQLAAWLEPSEAPTADHPSLARWDQPTWAAFRRAVTIHGLAPRLARSLPPALADAAPEPVLDWLREQESLNARRIARMHGELAGILRGAAEAGIEVLLLKGAVLTTLPDAGLHPRPMADLDLLVRPADRAGLRAVLEALGYRHEPEHSPRPTHDVFVDPGGGRVVARGGEHPDNPRRVELHVEVKRHLWGWVDDDDLTADIWRGAEVVGLLGERATVPRAAALFAHLAIHASSDLLVGRGRLVQWPDLWRAAGLLDGPVDLPHPRVAYPALALAARAMPRAAFGFDVAGLGARVPPVLTRWAATVPLDPRCGLSAGRPPDRPQAAAARLERWKPLPWRLAVAYGDLPLPLSLARHAGTIGRRALERAR